MNHHSNFFHFHAFSFPLADPVGVQICTLGVQVLSFSCSFRQKKLQNNRLAHRIWELMPNPQENLGSATVYDFKYVTMEGWSTVMETSVIMLSVLGSTGDIANRSGK